MIHQYLDAINLKIDECEKVMNTASNYLVGVPKQRVHVSLEHGKYRYYIYDEVTRKERYAGQKETELIQKLIEAEYFERLFDIAKSCKYHLKFVKRFFEQNGFDFAMEQMAIPKRTFLSKVEYTNKTLADAWLKMNYPHIPKRGRTFTTKKGEKVRSKSEKMMADLLFDLGLPYHYEETVVLPGGKMYSADFVILDVATGKKVILEHFGMMNDEKYSQKANQKIDDYIDAGYVYGDTFMYTYETGMFDFSLKSLENWLCFRFGVTRKLAS